MFKSMFVQQKVRNENIKRASKEGCKHKKKPSKIELQD